MIGTLQSNHQAFHTHVIYYVKNRGREECSKSGRWNETDTYMYERSFESVNLSSREHFNTSFGYNSATDCLALYTAYVHVPTHYLFTMCCWVCELPVIGNWQEGQLRIFPKYCSSLTLVHKNGAQNCTLLLLQCTVWWQESGQWCIWLSSEGMGSHWGKLSSCFTRTH